MNASRLRGLAALALVCFALPRAEAVSLNIQFSGLITEVRVIAPFPYSPPPPPPVSVGDTFAGSFWYSAPYDSGYTVSAGGWSIDVLPNGPSGPTFLIYGNQIIYQAERGITDRTVGWLNLIDYGAAGWGGDFSVLHGLFYMGMPSYRVSGILTVPDGGPSVLMFGLALVALAIHRRRELTPRALRGV